MYEDVWPQKDEQKKEVKEYIYYDSIYAKLVNSENKTLSYMG